MDQQLYAQRERRHARHHTCGKETDTCPNRSGGTFDTAVRELTPSIAKFRSAGFRDIRKLLQQLNGAGLTAPSGKPFSYGTLHRVLIRQAELHLGQGHVPFRLLRSSDPVAPIGFVLCSQCSNQRHYRKTVGAFKNTSAVESKTPLCEPDVEKMSRTNPQTLHGDRTAKLTATYVSEEPAFLWSRLE